MATASETKYSNVRYWRFVFLPLLLITLFFGIFILFTSPDTQVSDFGSVIQRTNSMLGNSRNLRA